MEKIIKMVPGYYGTDKAILFKMGNKVLGFTSEENGRYINYGHNFSFSNSDTLDRAIDIMKTWIINCINPLGNYTISFIDKSI